MRMSKILLVPVTVLAVGAGPLSVADSAAPPAKRAELVAKRPAAAFANGKLAVAVTIKNKGNKKAKKTQTGIYLSKDGKISQDDKGVAGLETKKLRPKRKTTLRGALPLPTGLQPGAYRVIACADATGKVRERKEGNNCKASRGTVTLPPGPSPAGKVTVSWTIGLSPLGLLGSVSGTATNGTCSGSDLLTGAGSCVVDAGTGSVVLTATSLLPLFPFSRWEGASCTSTANPLTVTGPTTDIACTAVFG
jgi:hypothetical protein